MDVMVVKEMGEFGSLVGYANAVELKDIEGILVNWISRGTVGRMG